MHAMVMFSALLAGAGGPRAEGGQGAAGAEPAAHSAEDHDSGLFKVYSCEWLCI